MMPQATGVVLLLAALAPAGVTAQTVVGTVTEGGSDRPVAGAMVRLLASGSATGAGYLTSEDGHYRLTAPAPGRYELQVERSGYPESRLGPVELRGTDSVTFDVAVSTARSRHLDEPTGGLRGTVFDSIRGRPLEGAEVLLEGQSRSARTDAEGGWMLEGIVPGRHRARFRHPVLDSLPLDPGWTEVSVRADSVTRADLALPPLRRLLALGCPEPQAGVLVGFVRDRFDRPLAGAEVRVVDSAGVVREPPPAVTGPDGAYQLCGLPADADVEVEAALGVSSSASPPIRTQAGLAVRTDLRLVVSGGIDDRSEGGAGGPFLSGETVDAETGSSLEAASVELLDEDGELLDQRLTDGGGGFRVRPPAPGRYRLRVRRLGYAEVTSQTLEVAEGPRRVEIRMVPEAVELEEGVVVEVEARRRALEAVGFYRRREEGAGRLFDRADLDAMNLILTGDIVNRVSTLATLPMSGRGSMDVTRRFLRFRRAGRGSGGCLPAIFVDGILIRQGGNWHSAMPSLDEIIPASEVEAMELYDGPSSAPSRFNSMGAACGVLVIWSRTSTGGDGDRAR